MITPKLISEARKAGFKRKKPKKPKAKTATAIKNYFIRCENWARDANAKIKAQKELTALKEKLKKA
jgi:hypothetical protein